MRIAIISDIHSNLQALNASYKALQEIGYDTLICLGDVIGYGPRPIECIDFMRNHDILCIRGNHDHYVTLPSVQEQIQPAAADVIKWTKETIRDDQLEWLNNLPLHLKYQGMTFVHASLEDNDGSFWPYILDSRTALLHFFAQDTEVGFFGHTHIPLLFTLNGRQHIKIEILKQSELNEPDATKFLINPGSVGQPRDFDTRSSAAIFDTEKKHVQIVRAEYNIEQTQKEISEANLPDALALRLSRGV